MNILILTEGGRRMGFGHITRCTSIYDAFEQKGIMPQFIVNGDGATEELLKAKKYQIFNWLDEKKRLFDMLQNADIAIIDSYLAGADIYNKASAIVKTPVYIDDTERLVYPRGVIVNVTADKNRTKNNSGRVYMYGPEFILLRKEFWDVPKKEIKDTLESIAVSFGGDDSRNFTPKVLKLLVKKFSHLTKNVIIGRGFKSITEIKNAQDAKTNFIYYPEADEMKKILLDSDIAISAGGQTMYELARIGIPTIAVAVAENQLCNINRLKKAGAIDYAGWYKNRSAESNITTYVRKLKDLGLRKKRSIAGRKFIDGKGSQRVRDAILSSFKEIANETE